MSKLLTVALSAAKLAERWCDMKFEDFSPLAGMLTGKGAMGKLIAQGFGGMIPAAIARNAQDAAEEEAEEGAEQASLTAEGASAGGASWLAAKERAS